MGKEYRNKTILISSLLLSFLIIFVSFFGLFNNQTYSKETINWTIQAIAQDAVDLFIITPFLLLSSSLLYKKNKVALLIWSGTLLYVIYTFVIYCFAVHFNFLFFFYCLTLGISFYLFMYYIFSQIKNPLIKDYNEKIPVKTVGIYLIILACIFYIFWLSEIVPPMLNNLTPKEIIDIGLPINPVHSLDMSIFLPGIFITGFLLLKKKQPGLFLVPAILVFTILMDLTIGIMNIFMNIKGLNASLSISFIMVFFTAISGTLLVKFLKCLQIK